VVEQPPGDVTVLLKDWYRGNPKALDSLVPVVYKELRRLARAQLRHERIDHTLHSAALVNEAYLRLVGLHPPEWETRSHFLAIAANLMRQILVDHARRHRAAKRGDGQFKVSISEVSIQARKTDVDVLALNDALESLAKIDPRQSQVVELRFFAGLSLVEISEALQIAPATVQRDWTAARAWLHREISRKDRE